jgi:signal transduction histidine kinase
MGRQTAIERIQAALFVDVFRQSGEGSGSRFWRGEATFRDLYGLVVRFVGREQADREFAGYARSRGINLSKLDDADANLVSFTETLLAGAIGAASARVMVASVVKGEIASIEEVMEILDEASQVIEYSHQLEQKSRELESATADLRGANVRLQELDRLKDDFLSMVSHELRTPLTSIRSLSEILYQNPDLDVAERSNFLDIIVKENERLTRLINEILDFAKMESGRMEWRMADIDTREVINEAIAATQSLLTENAIQLDVDMPAHLPNVRADRDRMIQVIVNLLSNAAKFCDGPEPRVEVRAKWTGEDVLIAVADNGPGVPPGAEKRIFEKFQQADSSLTGKPRGTGLGLPICRQIVEHFGGRIWVDNTPGRGARFSFTVPNRDTTLPVFGGRLASPGTP